MNVHDPARRRRLGAIGVAAVALLLVTAAAPVGAASPATSPGVSPAVPPVTSPGTSPVPSASQVPGALAVVGVASNGTIPTTGGVWQVNLPTLTGPLDPAVVSAVNDALAASSAAQVAAFQAASTKPPKGFTGVDGYTSDFSVALLTPQVLSLRILTSMYAAGAAHPAGTTTGWTFDLATGEQLRLADLFLPHTDHLQRLSGLSRHQLRARFDAAEVPRASIGSGTKPKPKNFAAWAMTPEGLEITFGEYQVGPYAIGMPVVLIPWARLSDLLDPAGPAAPFIVAAPSGSPAPAPSQGPSPAPSPAG